MNKAELVASIAEKSNLTKKDAESALNAFMKSVEEALVDGEKVQLVGFQEILKKLSIFQLQKLQFSKLVKL